ncbi:MULTISPECIES: hypothetical protein [Bacillus cereus group]|uniref:hypothetical protein n=1 Tax=Bacillus cereus group TaxID=86661 RepID=UPI00073F3128|nr:MULTISPECIES: hypothetical protein [Bacillus cereus group]KZD43489.1 hypothetical protein B4083_0889 [Bacillus cereus]KUH41422.1 hypothetical protein M2E15_1513 [Bacillus mycoides]MBE7127817.1 hypothetical protein [Bacillus mycoides]MDA1967658.1 hypothetical protein [Bacillus cereus]MDM5193248.1 hypothetical protein [Bacillus hominis]
MEIKNGRIHLYNSRYYLNLGSFGIEPIIRFEYPRETIYVYEYSKATIKLLEEMMKGSLD